MSSIPPTVSAAKKAFRKRRRLRQKEKYKQCKSLRQSKVTTGRTLRYQQRRARWREQVRASVAHQITVSDSVSDAGAAVRTGSTTAAAAAVDAGTVNADADDTETESDSEDPASSVAPAAALPPPPIIETIFISDDDEEVLESEDPEDLVRDMKKWEFEAESFLFTAPSSLPSAGLGVFTHQYIPRNTYLLPYLGLHLSEPQFIEKFGIDAMGEPQIRLDDFRYVLGLPGRRYIDASDPKRSNASRYVNHNLVRRCNCFLSKSAILIAHKAIHPGEELFLSYSSTFSRYLRRNGVVFESDDAFASRRQSLIDTYEAISISVSNHTCAESDAAAEQCRTVKQRLIAEAKSEKRSVAKFSTMPSTSHNFPMG